MPENPKGSAESPEHSLAASSRPSAQPSEHGSMVMLSIPWLHSEFEPLDLPEDVRFIDPGITTLDTFQRWRPVDLPLNEATAREFLRESAAFARERGKSRGVLDGAALAGQDIPHESAIAIQSMLTGGTRHRDDPARRSQQLLLLAWYLEEQALEIRALHQDVQAGWRKLDALLGVEEMEQPGHISTEPILGAPEDREPELPWRLVLEAVLYFVPNGSLLVTSHREVIDALADVPDCPPDQQPVGISALYSSLRTGAIRIIHAPAWRLLGAKRCPADKPWLERDHLVSCIGASGSGSNPDMRTRRK